MTAGNIDHEEHTDSEDLNLKLIGIYVAVCLSLELSFSQPVCLSACLSV